MPLVRPLIFDWPSRHILHLALPFALLVAVMLHVAFFYFFTIVYPTTSPIVPGRAQVYHIPPDSPDAERLAAILRTADPAVFAPGRGLSRGQDVPTAAYTPQYFSTVLPFAPLPSQVNEARRVVAFRALSDATRQRPDPVSSLPTTWRASGALGERLPAMSATFTPLPGEVLEATTVLVGVRGDGTVAHTIPQSSSGHLRRDAQALISLQDVRFVPGAPDLVWGIVTFSWGSDVRMGEVP